MSTYNVSVTIANIDDICSFAEKIVQMPECKSLTSEERAKIILSYPIRIGKV